MPTQPPGFLAAPPTGDGPGVLVLHAWWGLNDTIKAFCNRLAKTGFMVFAPDLYQGKVARTIADAEKYGQALDANHLQAEAEVVNATKFLRERVGNADQGLTVIGFSLGTFYALTVSNTLPVFVRSVVVFYGTWVEDLSNARADYLGHFAENDPYEPQANVDKLEAYLKRIGRPVTFYRYHETTHWFFESDRPEYSPTAAELAWERTLVFLKRDTKP